MAKHVDMSKFKRFGDAFHSQANGAPGPVNDFFKQAATRYLAAAQRRYDNFSRGAGDWKPLSAATIAARRKGKDSQGKKKAKVSAKLARTQAVSLKRTKSGKLANAGGFFAILKDTGQLRMALVEGSPGNFVERFPGGVRVGIKGGQAKDKKVTLGQLAAWHQFGMGHNPVRVIVPPLEQLPAQTTRGIQGDFKRAIEKLGKSL